MVTVKYVGFLEVVERQFPTMERAEQWARQCGKYEIATFQDSSLKQGDGNGTNVGQSTIDSAISAELCDDLLV